MDMFRAHDGEISFRRVLIVVSVFGFASYAFGVALLHVGLETLGRDTAPLETHLALISVLGIYTLSDHPAVLLLAAGMLVAAAWRFVRRRGRADFFIAFALTVLACVVSAAYATTIGLRDARAHAQAMSAAVAQGDRKALREAVFRCEAFCGFDADSGPLVWLLAQAATEADINAIGRMLQMDAPRNTRSAWLADPRTPIETAVDRFAADPRLVWYVLGIDSSSFHFQVGGMKPQDVDQALAHALKTGAAPALVQALERHGGKAPAGAGRP